MNGAYSPSRSSTAKQGTIRSISRGIPDNALTKAALERFVRLCSVLLIRSYLKSRMYRWLSLEA